MSDSNNVGSSGLDNASNDADRVIPRHTVDGKNAATGDKATFVNELENDTGSPHNRGEPAPSRKQGHQQDSDQYTQVTPEVASESHTLPGPDTRDGAQKAKDVVPTQ
ncbi:hypothetical protein PYCC9005_005658 [Savitreella phatthalungensis]